MSGPITNYELGKMRHREYEAEVSQYWGQNVTRDDKPSMSKKYKLASALSTELHKFVTKLQGTKALSKPHAIPTEGRNPPQP